MSNSLKFDINGNFFDEYVKTLSCLLIECLNIDNKNINIDAYIKEYLQNFKKIAKLHQLKEIINLSQY